MLAFRRHSRKLTWITRLAGQAPAWSALIVILLTAFWLPLVSQAGPTCVNTFAPVSFTAIVTEATPAEQWRRWEQLANLEKFRKPQVPVRVSFVKVPASDVIVHEFGSVSASRSLELSSGDEHYGIKMGTERPHGPDGPVQEKKYSISEDIRKAKSRMPYLEQVEAKIGSDPMLILAKELVAVEETVAGEGYLIRDLSDTQLVKPVAEALGEGETLKKDRASLWQMDEAGEHSLSRDTLQDWYHAHNHAYRRELEQALGISLARFKKLDLNYEFDDFMASPPVQKALADLRAKQIRLYRAGLREVKPRGVTEAEARRRDEALARPA